MLFIIIWIIIGFFIVRGITKSSKPDYVIDWEKKVEANQNELRIGHTVEPTVKLSEKDWMLHIHNHYTTGKN